MISYLAINLFIIIFPLLLSFESKITYYKKLKNVFFSIIIVSTIFIIWDIYATIRGDWSFNNNFLVNYRLFFLPIEEILFFITVPYSMIFLFETAKLYIKDNILQYNKTIYNIIALFFLVISVFFIDKYYTFTVFIFVSLSLVVLNYLSPHLLKSKVFFILLLFSYVPFFVVNYLLTSIPIVEYSSSAILNIRVITIPIEDFFYSFSLISLYISFYEMSLRVWKIKQ
ncbi:MAG TPA: lycopene cyclase domain-containing protein [Melioribacteraceae bacterium]|nr:lycopene cyclase domain-containing protein [Melioribacteraceae bacterium]